MYLLGTRATQKNAGVYQEKKVWERGKEGTGMEPGFDSLFNPPPNPAPTPINTLIGPLTEVEGEGRVFTRYVTRQEKQAQSFLGVSKTKTLKTKTLKTKDVPRRDAQVCLPTGHSAFLSTPARIQLVPEYKVMTLYLGIKKGTSSLCALTFL